MADYKLGFFGEEIDLKLQEIEELRGGITQLQQNNETITAAIERIDALVTQLGQSALGVKKVQRGVLQPTEANRDGTYTSYYAGTSTTTLAYKDIAISEVNLEKSFVIIHSLNFYGMNYYDISGYLKDSTTLRLVGNQSGVNFNVAWEVIEFY